MCCVVTDSHYSVVKKQADFSGIRNLKLQSLLWQKVRTIVKLNHFAKRVKSFNESAQD